MRLASTLALALLAGCARTCPLEPLTALEPGAVDCGHLRPGQDPGPLRACVLAAVAAHRPFRALWDVAGIDSHLEAGLLGTADGALWDLWSDSDATGRRVRLLAKPFARRQRCAAIGPAPACTPAPGEPCLACVSPSAGERLCPTG